jgi:hypothetical protein
MFNSVRGFKASRFAGYKGEPLRGLECFCVCPPAVPGVIHIKPLRGFVFECAASVEIAMLCVL